MKKSNLKSLINQIVKETIIKKLGEGQPIGGVKNDHDFDGGRKNVMKAVNVAENNGRSCECGSGLSSEWQYDGQGIELCRACPKCKQKKLSKYRPEILRGYTQSDVDEPIESEDDRCEEVVRPNNYLGKDLFDKRRELESQINQLREALKEKRFFGKVEEIRGQLNRLERNLIKVNIQIRTLINQSKNYQSGGAQMYPREAVGFDGKYVDDMESGVAVKKLHGLDESADMNQQRAVVMLQDFARRLIYSLGIKDRSSYVKAEKVIQEFLPTFSEYFPDQNLNEETGTGAVAGYQTPFAFSKKKMGSSRAIASAKKYGKVVKSISENK